MRSRTVRAGGVVRRWVARTILRTGVGRQSSRSAEAEDILDRPWTPAGLRALLAVLAVLAVALLAGVVWSLQAAVTGGRSEARTSPRAATEPLDTAEDQLADRLLPLAPLEAAQPGAGLSTGRTGILRVPLPMSVGEAGVPTGFPHTTAGALAQLAAIDATALSSASIRTAQEVIDGWAALSGPTAETWTGVEAVATLLDSAGTVADGDGLTVEVEPSMGFIKGSLGSDFVIPCIDFVVTATLEGGRSQQVAVADCQRMVWQTTPRPAPSSQTNPTAIHASPQDPAVEDEGATPTAGSGTDPLSGDTGQAPPHTSASETSSAAAADPAGSEPDAGRWVIGPGSEPADAPSLWPGSQASFDAGYLWLEIPQR